MSFLKLTFTLEPAATDVGPRGLAAAVESQDSLSEDSSSEQLRRDNCVEVIDRIGASGLKSQLTERNIVVGFPPLVTPPGFVTSSQAKSDDYRSREAKGRVEDQVGTSIFFLWNSALILFRWVNAFQPTTQVKGQGPKADL